MLPYLNKIHKASLLLIALVVLMVSCKKAVVNFGEEALTDDPNVVFLDTLTVELSTFQTDSFATAGDNLFKVGIHEDSIFGKYESTAYMQVGVPSTNSINGLTNCVFDSVVFITKYSGTTYGDTTEPFTLNVHRLNQQMKADITPIGYNTNSFSYDAAALGSIQLTNTRAYQKQQVSVKLPDALGIELFDMLKRNSDTITDATKFNKYFNGFALKGKGQNNHSMYYFQNYDSSNSVVMKVYYTINATTPSHAAVDFAISPATYQFNGYTYDKSNTYLSLFTPKKREVISSVQTGNRVYLHNNSGLFPHLYFPYLFNIKELHPYIKVIKAELVIEPSLMNYGPNNFYRLPPTMTLFNINADKQFGNAIYEPGSTSVLQTGNLIIDNLNHINTRYTYDLTTYINNILTQGVFSQNPLVVIPTTSSIENRLILDDVIGNKSVKLKLYVLGL